MINKDGQFTLTTDNGKTAGAVVGSHKVVLVDLAASAKVPVNMPGAVENVDLKSVRFPDRIADPNRTPLKAAVTAGRTNTIDLQTGP